MRLEALAVALLAAGCAWGASSPLVPAAHQVEPYLTRLAEAPDFAASFAAYKLSEQVEISGFPLTTSRNVDLNLTRVRVLTANAKIVDGSTGALLPEPNVALFRGTVNGEPDSSVYLSFSPYGHQGWVTVRGEQFILSSGPAAGDHTPVIYRFADIPADVMSVNGVQCGGALAPMAGHVPAVPHGGNGWSARGGCRTAQIAVDTDYEFTASTRTFSGDATASAAYIVTLFGAIDEVYQREFQTAVLVPYLRVWSSDNDPYPAAGYVPDRLDQFQAEWNNHRTDIVRNVAHMLSTGNVGGVGGIAYLPALCDQFYGYGVSGYINGHFPYPLEDHNNQNWDVVVTTHEIGHNFGAPHTHDVSPPIDSCAFGDCSLAAQGTIMSYCHTCPGGLTNIALNMHPRIIGEYVIPFLNSLATDQVCTLEGGGAPVITTQPADTTVMLGGHLTIGVAARGAEPLHYQWLHNGSLVIGGTMAVLQFDSVGREAEGQYQVLVSNDCGQTASRVATVTISGRCYADFNLDRAIDFFDYLDFVQAFAVDAAAADVNDDGVVDLFDYLDFVNQFSNGC